MKFASYGSAVALCIASVTLACSSDVDSVTPSGAGARAEPVELGRAASALQGGQKDGSHPFGLAICVGSSPINCAYRCSGTLIGPNLLLTARHCLYQTADVSPDCHTAVFDGPPAYAPSAIWVTTDPVARVAAPECTSVAGTVANCKSSYVQTKRVVLPNSRALCGADLALLVLRENIVSTAAVPAVEHPLTDRGAYSGTVTLVGYGDTGPTTPDQGTRHVRESVAITCLADDAALQCDAYADGVLDEREFEVAGGPCAGDSGSGAFEQTTVEGRTPVVVGVLTRGIVAGDTCSSAIYTRLDRWAGMLSTVAKEAAVEGSYPVPAWATAPLPNVGKFAARSVGADCNSPSECDSNLCSSADGGLSWSCAAPCVAGACGDGLRCVPTGTGESLCFPKLDEPPLAKSGCGLATSSDQSSNWAVVLLLGTIALAGSMRRRSRASTR